MPLTIKKWITTKLFGTVANDYNDNLDAIKAFVDGLEANASFLHTDDPMTYADGMTSGTMKCFMTVSDCINGQYAVGIIMRRIAMRFIVAITIDRCIYVNTKRNDTASWLGWKLIG